jgi:pimeloyl-ACP methyl ester carboxylesterase
MPRISANGIELEYDERGSGEPLLLVMGLGAQMILWDEEMCDLFVERGFRVIRFDNRDVGLSTKLEEAGVPNVRQMLKRAYLGGSVDAAYDLGDMADDAAALLDALGIESAHIVGASLGGMIAQTLASRHPQKVRSLTSIMSSTGARWRMLAKPRAMKELLKRPTRDRQAAVDNFISFFRIVRGPRFSFNEERLRNIAGRAFDRSFYPRGVARQLAAIAASGDRTTALRTIEAPTLVIHGSHDPLVLPGGGRATARAIPGARLKIIDGMGHEMPRGAWPIIVNAVRRHALR